MYSEYVKEATILEKNEDEQDKELLQNIKEVKIILNNMHNNLQFAETDLVDYYTYQIKAEEARYCYLLKLAKKRDLKVI
jgi:hypothetical protein